MPTADHGPQQRLEARLGAKQKALLQHAADLKGRTLSDFVLSAAYESAARVIKEHEEIALSLRDREIFVKALLNPPEPTQALKEAVAHYKEEVKSK